jgi:ribosomal protein S27E
MTIRTIRPPATERAILQVDCKDCGAGLEFSKEDAAVVGFYYQIQCPHCGGKPETPTGKAAVRTSTVKKRKSK